MIQYQDKEGKPLELLEWAKLLEDKKYQVIKQGVVGTHWVSTVWLGLEHGFREGEPLIFETMVFADKGKGDSVDEERYCTVKEAVQGHEGMVKKWELKK